MIFFFPSCLTQYPGFLLSKLESYSSVSLFHVELFQLLHDFFQMLGDQTENWILLFGCSAEPI